MGDPERSHALFSRVHEAHPRDPWTAVTLAEAARGVSSAEVLDALERALELARSGEARPHCPVEVLEAFLADHRQRVEEGRLRRYHEERDVESPLRTDCIRAVHALRSTRADQERRLRTDLEDLEQDGPQPDAAAARRAKHAASLQALDEQALALATRILEGNMSEWIDSPRPVLVVRLAEPDRVAWIVPTANLPAARTAAERLSMPAEGRPWRGWQRLELSADVPWRQARQAAADAGLALVRGDGLLARHVLDER